MTDSDRRDVLLDAILTHVAFDGWTQTALLRAGEDLGLSASDVALIFPRGPEEAIQAFSRRADTQMLSALEELDLQEMRVHERVTAGVRARLECVAGHREAVQRGLSFFAMPQNARLGLSCLYRTVDAIWYAAGDRSTDYNYYSKRLLLSGVYSSTVLYWLNDRSEDFAPTWAFLERRIGEVMKVGGRLGKAVGGLLNLPDRIFARSGMRRPGRGARRA